MAKNNLDPEELFRKSEEDRIGTEEHRHAEHRGESSLPGRRPVH